jgi:hypothetical protein
MKHMSMTRKWAKWIVQNTDWAWREVSHDGKPAASKAEAIKLINEGTTPFIPTQGCVNPGPDGRCAGCPDAKPEKQAHA